MSKNGKQQSNMNPSRQLKYYHSKGKYRYERKLREKRCPEKIKAEFVNGLTDIIQCDLSFKHPLEHKIAGRGWFHSWE